jgi:hypothetical protein
MEPSELVPGDWIVWKYGFNPTLWYVAKNFLEKEIVLVNSTHWCVSSAMGVNYIDLNRDRGFVFLGHTKRKWYWKLLAFTDLCHPFKTIIL